MRNNHLRPFFVYTLIISFLCTESFFTITQESYLKQVERFFRAGHYTNALTHYRKSDGDERVEGVALANHNSGEA